MRSHEPDRRAGRLTTPTPAAPRPGRREIIDYLRASAPQLQLAIQAHREFTQLLTPLYAEANAGQSSGPALKARALGKKYGPVFNQHLERVQIVVPPPTAHRAQEYLTRWLQFLISASGALSTAPEDGRDTTYLRDCHDYLDDARYQAKALGDLRQRLHDAVATPAKTTATAKDP